MANLHQFFEPSPSSPAWEGFCHPSKFPGKEAWSLNLYKHGAYWATNFWAFQLYDELLCNGSEECLDWHYEELAHEPANWQSEMKGTFSLAPLDGFSASSKLLYLEPWEINPKASWYHDQASGLKWWLCPLWLDLWPSKQPPKEAWLYLSQ